MSILRLEIADTHDRLAEGLMFRKNLPEDGGMFFKFPNLIEASFWGKNTYIPLDIAFIDSNNRIVDIKVITPHSTRMIRSQSPCVAAIETNVGFFREHDIRVGQKIEINPDGDICTVKFAG